MKTVKTFDVDGGCYFYDEILDYYKNHPDFNTLLEKLFHLEIGQSFEFDSLTIKRENDKEL